MTHSNTGGWLVFLSLSKLIIYFTLLYVTLLYRLIVLIREINKSGVIHHRLCHLTDNKGVHGGLTRELWIKTAHISLGGRGRWGELCLVPSSHHAVEVQGRQKGSPFKLI
jgi:hypothetical protein